MFCKKNKSIGTRKPGAILCSALLLAALLCGCGDSGSLESSSEEAKESETSQSNVPQTAEESQPPEETQAPAAISFEAQDMEGNAVTAEVFGQSRLTMVNVWATYCNPCLSEMPALGELAGEYDGADFQLIGIVSDVMEGADEGKMEEARGLIEQTGAAYTHLLLNRSVYDALLTDVSGVPTTFFFDQEGNLLGAVEGAAKKERWKGIIDGLLEDLPESE